MIYNSHPLIKWTNPGKVVYCCEFFEAEQGITFDTPISSGNLFSFDVTRFMCFMKLILEFMGIGIVGRIEKALSNTYVSTVSHII